MAYPLNLGTTAWDAYLEALAGSHSVRVAIDVLTTNHERVASLENRVITGQVNVDAGADITRSATVQFSDPTHSLHFDSDSPADGALYADRMLQIVYSVRAPSGSWVDVPVFTGPVVKFTRNAGIVDVECQGKELLAMGAAWRTQTYKKLTPKRDVIRSVLVNEGERFFSFPEFGSRLPGDRSVSRTTVPWTFAKGIARSAGYRLYYDGAGRARLSKPSAKSLFTFRDGPGGTILTQPTVSFSLDNVRNVIHVIGGAPKGQKKKVRYTLTAPREHPLSPWRLGRNGQPRYLVETIEDTSIRSDREARRVALPVLNARLLQAVDVGFESMVIPHLEEGDHITTATRDFSVDTRLGQFTIPLPVDGRMTVGYLKRVGIRKARIR